jgi:P27 family predicted phage terminase small subunit
MSGISEPDWASKYTDDLDIAAARAHWARVIDDLSVSGGLSPDNGHAIRRLVEFRVVYERSSRHVAEQGPILAGKRAKVGQWNPHWSAMRQAAADILALEAELGLLPTRRGKIVKVEGGKAAPRAADRFLRAVS